MVRSYSTPDTASARVQRLDSLRKELSAADFETDEVFVVLLKRTKDELGYTDQELADALNVSRPTISRWLSSTHLPHRVMRGPVFGWAKREVGRRSQALKRQVAKRSERNKKPKPLVLRPSL